MAEPTVEEMLVNVRTAINDALVAGGAVEVEINGRRVKRDYNQLRELEKALIARSTSSSTTGGNLRTHISFGRPR